MEIKHRDNNFSVGFNDGLDSELDGVGVILDTPIICGECMLEMEKVGETEFRCRKCGNSMTISKY